MIGSWPGEDSFRGDGVLKGKAAKSWRRDGAGVKTRDILGNSIPEKHGFPSNSTSNEQQETLLCHGILSFEPCLQLEKWNFWFWDVFPLRNGASGSAGSQCKQWVSRTYPGGSFRYWTFILFQVSQTQLKQYLVWMTKLCQSVEPLEPTLYALLEKAIQLRAKNWCDSLVVSLKLGSASLLESLLHIWNHICNIFRYVLILLDLRCFNMLWPVSCGSACGLLLSCQVCFFFSHVAFWFSKILWWLPSGKLT